MKRSYLEALFRHKLLVLVPALVVLVLGAGYGFSKGRSFVASASVFVDNPLPDASSIGTVGGSTPPSGGQQAFLAGLLASRGFLLDAANRGPLKDTVARLSGPAVDDKLSAFASSVTISTPGPQVMSLAVKQDTPELATGMTQALVDAYIKAESDALEKRAASQVAFDKQQVDAAANTLAAAGPAGAGSGGAISGPAQQYSDAQRTLSKDTAALAHVRDSSYLRVLDQPTQAYPQSRRKAILFGAAGGMLAAVSLAVATLVLLMLRERGVREETELEELLGIQVVGTISELPRTPRRAIGARPSTQDTAWSETS